MSLKIKEDFIGNDVAIAFPQVIPVNGGPQFMTIQAKLIDQDEESITVLLGTSEGMSETQIAKEKFLMISKISSIKSGIGLISPDILSRIKKPQS